MKKKMILALPALLILGLGMLFFFDLNKKGNASEILDNPRNISLEITGEDGHTRPILSEQLMADRIIVINFWASWCMPCRIEHEWVSAIGRHKDIHLIGIAYRDNEDAAQQFLKELGDPYHQWLLDPNGSFAVELGITGVPETFVINEKSQVIWHKRGPLDAASFHRLNEYIKQVSNNLQSG